MIEIRKNVRNNCNHFKIVPQGHNNCQLSIVNCQFGEAVKFQFVGQVNKTEKHKKTAFRPPNIYILLLFEVCVYSQFFQILCPFLMKYPILKRKGICAMIKAQKE